MNPGSSAEELLKLSEERHRLLAEHANDVVWTMSAEGAITYVSPAVESMRGFTPEEAMNQTIEQIHPPDSQAISLGYFNRLAVALQEGSPAEEFRCELEYYCKDGSTVWTDVQVIPHLGPDGELLEILGVSRDISQRKTHERELEDARREAEVANEALTRANERLRQQALTDDLTGTYNRRHGRDLLESATAGTTWDGMPLSLLMIDIDCFKKVNDDHGHHTGDQVLVDLTRRISAQIRDTDILARWGGDEFIVMMPLCDIDGATLAAEKIREAVASEPFDDAGTVTVSIGVAQASEDRCLEQWVARADSALYEAKSAGRNRVETVQPAPATPN